MVHEICALGHTLNHSSATHANPSGLLSLKWLFFVRQKAGLGSFAYDWGKAAGFKFLALPHISCVTYSCYNCLHSQEWKVISASHVGLVSQGRKTKWWMQQYSVVEKSHKDLLLIIAGFGPAGLLSCSCCFQMLQEKVSKPQSAVSGVISSWPQPSWAYAWSTGTDGPCDFIFTSVTADDGICLAKK